jgi:hypothetical protein
MCAEKFSDRVRRFAGHDEIEIAHDFFATTETSGHAYLRGIAMGGQVAAQLFSLCSDFAELKGTGMFRAISDGIANFRLCRLPESW